MATKAETFRSDDERTKSEKKAKKPAAEKKTNGRATRHASHATVARESEARAPGPKSRKSSRASANRARSDNELVRHAASEKAKPSRRAADARAKRTRARAKGA